MKLYWVFEQRTDKTTNRSDISNKLRASGDVPKNKAAMGAMVDTLTGAAADFHGGKGELPSETNVGKGKGNKQKGSGKEGAQGKGQKKKKALH